MKGSFTVELSIIFPVIFIILVVLVQCGLFFSYRIYALNAINQSLMICSQARSEGMTPEEAVQCAGEYLHEELDRLPIRIEEIQWEQSVGWLKEEYAVGVSARYSFVISISWSAFQKSNVINPVVFRNRLDFIWEKGRRYLDE